jgi:predicted lipoprotein with Yx(FWY)xxD motif
VHSSTYPRRRAAFARLALFALAAAAMVLPATAAAASKTVAKEGSVAALGKTVLTNSQGRTLYSLSAETHGRFICTGSCTSTWRPLLVQAGTTPTGPVKLGTVERPEGKTQVTYKGRPLYTFSGDTKSGQANGEGIKDVGTWHAAALARSSSGSEMPSQEPAPYSPPSGY